MGKMRKKTFLFVVLLVVGQSAIGYGQKSATVTVDENYIPNDSLETQGNTVHTSSSVTETNGMATQTFGITEEVILPQDSLNTFNSTTDSLNSSGLPTRHVPSGQPSDAIRTEN